MASYLGGVMTTGETAFWDPGEGGEGFWVNPDPVIDVGAYVDPYEVPMEGPVDPDFYLPYDPPTAPVIIAPGAGYGNIGGGGEQDSGMPGDYVPPANTWPGDAYLPPTVALPPSLAPEPMPQPWFPPAVAEPEPATPENQIPPVTGGFELPSWLWPGEGDQRWGGGTWDEPEGPLAPVVGAAKGGFDLLGMLPLIMLMGMSSKD